jgi:hypothetical protein
MVSNPASCAAERTALGECSGLLTPDVEKIASVRIAIREGYVPVRLFIFAQADRTG